MAPDDIEPGDVITGFTYSLPRSDETCCAQIAASIARGLPDAVERRNLIVVASGPSARGVDLECLVWPTLALNGALSLFLEQGLEPTYWACCDPQECVADFIPDNPPLDTIYLVASKCHASVFEKLKGRDVRVWHLLDHPAEGRSRIALCSSVTLSATWLMHRLGFTDFEYYGWDGCFIDDKHHATSTSEWDKSTYIYINYGGTVKDGQVTGGRNYSTTRTWAAEAHGAEQFFQLAKYYDIMITIHGDGMFARVQKALLL